MKIVNIYEGLKEFSYVCKVGDTICSLSEKFNVPISLIKELNKIEGEPLCGQEIFIKRGNYLTYRVGAGDTEESILSALKLSLLRVKNKEIFSVLYPGKMLFIDVENNT